MANYSGNSIVDYLSSTGQASDFNSRASIAASKGISNYTGTAAQNTQLLQALKAGSPPTPAAAPVTPPAGQPNAQARTVQPTPAPQSQKTPSTSAPSQSGGEQELINAMTSKGHTPESAKAAIQGRGYNDLAREYLGTQSGASSLSGDAMTATPSIDLPKLYQTLYDSSGISAKQDEYNLKEKQYLEAKAKISDNPFLDASTVDKRLRKLNDIYDAETAPLRNEIATRKADIETQMNLQTKQFDINSQAARESLSRFNALLEIGALDNASGEDIANITRSTGISSGLILGAVEARKTANLQTSIQSFDDGNEEGFTIYTIDPNGNIVNQTRQVTGRSKAKSTGWTTDSTAQKFIDDLLSGDGYNYEDEAQSLLDEVLNFKNNF